MSDGHLGDTGGEDGHLDEVGQRPDPMCACGHPKSDHNVRFAIGARGESLVCDTRLEATGRPGRMRDTWCKCVWFRLALGQ
jgi:hypothetical protein